MANYIDEFMEASGVDTTIKANFESLVAGLPKSGDDQLEVAKRIKNYLRSELGFQYDQRSFTIQDMLGTRRANCLGFPLLIGTILGESGFCPRYRLITNPRDITYELECEEFRQLSAEMPYDKPRLAAENEQFPVHRFTQLEHLVLDFDGNLFETTSEEHEAPQGENPRDLTFIQALSCVLKDRAVYAMVSGKFDLARQHTKDGLKCWDENREIHFLLSGIALETFDDATYQSAIKKFQEIGGVDSLFNLHQYLFTRDESFLIRALKDYPADARALEMQASRLVDSDPREARYLFALSSQCYAKSEALDLVDFYAANAEELIKLFGREDIQRAVIGFDPQNRQNFYLQIRLFDLTGQESALVKARELAITPRKKLIYLSRALGTEHSNLNYLQRLDQKYQNSTLFKKLRKDLKI